MHTSQVPTTKTLETGRPETGDFFLSPGYLMLADGTVFAGQIPPSQPDSLTGELVFTTGMTGYVETLTDPSYAGQLITFTYPLIGNYGVPASSEWESNQIHARGVIVSSLSRDISHANHPESLPTWLQKQRVPFITGVDTRALTKHLRTKGSMPAVISQSHNAAVGKLHIPFVSVPAPIHIGPTKGKHVLLVDCGAKEGITRQLLAAGLRITRVPHDFDYKALTFDGIFLSNGPGDPTDYETTIRTLKPFLGTNTPIFGICLGTQIMALAAGAKTYKLLFGHRGHNQPVVTPSGKGHITSQNHGYAIDERTLPKDWSVSFRNLNDNSVEGITHKTRPHAAVQFHPEASPGPTDTSYLIKQFAGTL